MLWACLRFLSPMFDILALGLGVSSTGLPTEFVFLTLGSGIIVVDFGLNDRSFAGSGGLNDECSSLYDFTHSALQHRSGY